MNTLYVNLLAAPGASKSTTAAGVFFYLKINRYNAELITEYAKDKVWGKDYKSLQCQPYILGKQLYRQYRLLGEVDIAVTDSPILLGLLYKGFGSVEGWDEVLVKQFNLFNNLNIYLERNPEVHPYNPLGRSQTEEQAVVLQSELQSLLHKYRIPYHTVRVTEQGTHVDTICDLIKRRLEE